MGLSLHPKGRKSTRGQSRTAFSNWHLANTHGYLLKAKIVLAITFMVAVLVLAFSYIYISELLRQRVTTARESAAQLTSNLAYLAANAAPDLSSTKVDTTNPAATRRAV